MIQEHREVHGSGKVDLSSASDWIAVRIRSAFPLWSFYGRIYVQGMTLSTFFLAQIASIVFDIPFTADCTCSVLRNIMECISAHEWILDCFATFKMEGEHTEFVSIVGSLAPRLIFLLMEEGAWAISIMSLLRHIAISRNQRVPTELSEVF